MIPLSVDLDFSHTFLSESIRLLPHFFKPLNHCWRTAQPFNSFSCMRFINWMRTVLTSTSSRQAPNTRSTPREGKTHCSTDARISRCLLHVCRAPLFIVLRGLHGRTLDRRVDVERQILVHQCDEREQLRIIGAWLRELARRSLDSHLVLSSGNNHHSTWATRFGNRYERPTVNRRTSVKYGHVSGEASLITIIILQVAWILMVILEQLRLIDTKPIRQT